MSPHNRPLDKVQATCKLCYGKIGKGSWRVAEHYLFEKLQKWSARYYHKECYESLSSNSSIKRSYEKMTPESIIDIEVTRQEKSISSLEGSVDQQEK